MCIGYLLSIINVFADYQLVSLKSGLFWCQMTAFKIKNNNKKIVLCLGRSVYYTQVFTATK